MRRALALIVGFLCLAATGLVSWGQSVPPPSGSAGYTLTAMDPAKLRTWTSQWDVGIVGDAQTRYCDTTTGESTGWYMQPMLNGFYYGYVATKDPNWVARLVDWTDSWVKRGVMEPDGYLGWPAFGGGGTTVDHLDSYYSDSMLGDAMVLTPVVEMASLILATPSLNAKYGAKAQSYLQLSSQMYAKWNTRGGWRDTAGGGAISVELPFGIDPNTGKWVDFATRNNPGHGFSHPENMANETGMWLLSMYDATKDANYKTQATKWFTLMKSRMKLEPNGVYDIWNYWQPAGAWDYNPDGSPKLWVGTHPNAGYYEIDVRGIVDAFQHGVVFTQDDINHLIATALADGRYWTSLVPYSPAIQSEFESTMDPASWGGHGSAAWYLALQTQVPEPASLVLLTCGAAALLRRRRRRRR